MNSKQRKANKKYYKELHRSIGRALLSVKSNLEKSSSIEDACKELKEGAVYFLETSKYYD